MFRYEMCLSVCLHGTRLCVFSALMSLPVTAECSYTNMLVTWMLEDTPTYVIVFSMLSLCEFACVYVHICV